MKKLILGLFFGTSLFPLEAAVLNFSNPASISMNEPATVHTAPTVAAPYPSTIAVSGVTDPVSTIRVTLNNINQPRPDDMEILLVSPGGVKFVILSDAGGAATGAVGVNLTLGDSGATQVPDAGPLTTGTFQPTCVDSANNIDTGFPAPAPAGPYNKPAPRGTATFASAFAGINVNGTWSLYAVDDSLNSPQTASITGGWTIEITTTVTQMPSVTTLSSTPNPSFTTAPGNAVTFTATVTKQSDGTPVTTGTVTFKEGATTLAANVAVNGSGQAAFNTSTLTEGSHAISAIYNESATFLTSTGNMTQTVDNHTVVNGTTFCNPGAITFADAIAPGGASVYPSRMFVSGLSGTIKKVTAQIKMLNHARPDDIDLLLVSPNGTKFILMSDAGGTTAASAATLTFDDAAASTLPDAGPLVTGTFRPSSYTSADTFPAPAPAGPYLTPEVEGADTLAAFNGVSPNGTWTFYAVDDIQNTGQVNTIANGWCLTFVINLPPVLGNVPKSGNEDGSVTFTAADFTAHFTDGDAGDTLQTLRITSLPANGTLKLGAVNVVVNQDIPAAQIGNLNYTPVANYNGTDTFNWNASDGAAFAVAAAAVNLTVVAVNDVPAFTKGADQTALEDAGARTVAGWATTLSAGSATEAAQMLNFIAGNNNPALFTLQPAITANGTLTFTPAPNANGSATVTVQIHDNGGTANGGVDTSGPQSFLITVTAVNDAPGFTKGADQTVLEDAGAQTVAGWATALSAGPANEAAQALNFIVGNNNPALFSAQPAIAANGTLTYAPAANANGSAVVTVQIHDIGGTANAGVDTSAPQSILITVMAVNDVPGFTKGANQTANEDAGAQSVSGWAAAISAGPSDEAGQALNFIVGNNNPALFSAQPAIAANGTLTYTPAANANGSATVSAQIHDNGGTANAGVDTSGPQSFLITITAVNDNPVAVADTLERFPGLGVTVTKAALIANDTDIDGDTVAFVSVAAASANGGTVTSDATQVIYTPASGFTGVDTFTYNINDGHGGTATGTVTVAMILDATKMEPLAGGSVRLTFNGIPGRTYRVQSNESLTPASWTVRLSIAADAQGKFQFTDPAPLPRRRLYRALFP